MRFYTAGGAVRDLLLGRPMRDADFVFAERAVAVILRYPALRKIKDEPHPIYLLNGQEYTPLNPHVPLQAALDENLQRRDFTINALLLSGDGVIHAHKLAFEDLRSRHIRPASSSSLRDDPARAFRAARFTACLPGFSLHAETLTQMRCLAAAPDASVLASIAAERVGGELRKACLGDKPGNFLRALDRGDCLCPWFAEFAAAAKIPAGPPARHETNVLEHTARVMDACALRCANDNINGKERALTIWMALCHDIGKCVTPAHVLPRHIGHQVAGETLARDLGLRLRLPALFIKAGRLAARLHMKAGRYHELRPGTRVDLLMALHNAGLFTPFTLMVAADSAFYDLPELMERDRERILAVSLPVTWKNRGPEAGAKLRELRAMQLVSVQTGQTGDERAKKV